MTTALAHAVTVLARLLSWQETARHYGLNWKMVASVVKRAVEYGSGSDAPSAPAA